jgi:hypothetical protein
MAWQNETPAAQYAKRELEAKLNGPTFFDPELVLMLDIPRFCYYIFNVGPMDFTVPKGSAGPRGGYRIKGCEKGKHYSEPLIIPSIVTDTYMQEDQMKTHSVTGAFMCQDIVRPMNGQMWSIGQNLDDFGVFWTKNKVPIESELIQARAKMEGTFRAALAEANMLEAQNRIDLITPLMRHAASYFEEDRKWNQTYKRVIECPNCGEGMKAGIAVHTCGAVLDWAKAILFSARTVQQAKDAGVWDESLEKRLAELRAAAAAPKPAAPTNEGGQAFAGASELLGFEELSARERAYAEPTRRAPADVLEEQDPDRDAVPAGTAPAKNRQKTGKNQPPKPKRPAGFREK